MKLSKSSLLILITYFFIFFLPSILISFFNLGKYYIPIQTLDYLLGAVLLSTIALQTTELNSIEYGRKPFINAIFWGVIGLGLILLLQFIINLLTIASGASTTSQNTQTLLTLAKTNSFFIFAITIGAPIMEELVFRKVLFGNLSNLLGWNNTNLGLVITALISSLAFAFMHSDGHIILYASIGLLFCWLYNRTGRIQTSMITHMLMNSLIAISAIFMK
ncbi:CPBP family intramembrane glutamic endopeptidase [Pediococcus claussenii]|uniref:CAAX amino terminal protease self-immunity family protein n=1 Tax=Pediococcus claussenii (strain ATCC BAA-344 / DSM 14800 / JCM 18046 / KCTC 3811 / LMG 21948 / P06) TaxID=701521 RepID=G8PBZ3_PEDCP|nr:type II CAAX endopeptidase family protein [Pediococcus claussenii]AEV94812.1 CAAX amino terminal protease self- immunity family protein [Pediococcus claussenii ATCC BAA-344]